MRARVRGRKLWWVGAGAIAGLVAILLSRSITPVGTSVPDVGAGIAASAAAGPSVPDAENVAQAAAPPSIRLGQASMDTSGSVGPFSSVQGSAAIWEGHALSVDAGHDESQTLYMFVESDALKRVTWQVNDESPIVENEPGAYVSGEFTLTQSAQTYSLRVSAEDAQGSIARAAIYVTGADARVEGVADDATLHARMLRMGHTKTNDVRGNGYQGKVYAHQWPSCDPSCDLSQPGGALVGMVSGPTDALVLMLDDSQAYVASGFSSSPNPDYLLVAIPVHGEDTVELGALTDEGAVATCRWERALRGELAL